MDNKHICFISNLNPYKKPGGAELQTLNWMKMFKNDGHKVSLITEDRGQKIETRNIRIEYIPPRLIFNIYTCFILFLQLIKLNPDICYQRLKNEFTFVVGLYALLFRKKFIWWCSSDAETKKYSYYSRAKRKFQKKSIKHILGIIDGSIVSIFSELGIKFADVLVCQTYEQKKKFSKIANKNKIKVIRNSIFINALDTPNDFNKKNIVTWIGNLKRVKRPELFLELIKKIDRKDIKFIMIGRLNNNYLNILKDFKNDYNYNFEYLGYQSRKKIINILKNSKILVNTSKYEGFSNTYIEAWLVCTKIFSTQSNPDGILNNGKLGFCCNNLIKLANRITDTLTQWNNDCQYLRKFVINYFSIQNNYKKVKSILE